jgi:hypothetical protein
MTTKPNRPFMFAVPWETVEARVQAYLERVTKLQGQAAVDAWCKYTGYNDLGQRNRTAEQCVARAAQIVAHRGMTP